MKFSRLIEGRRDPRYLGVLERAVIRRVSDAIRREPRRAERVREIIAAELEAMSGGPVRVP